MSTGAAGAREDNESLEIAHWTDVMRTFLLYTDFMEMNIQRKQEHLNRLSTAYADRLPSITYDKIGQLHAAALRNQHFLTEMIRFQDYNFEPRADPTSLPDKYKGKKIFASQMHRNNAVLHSLAREWSSNGQAERDSTFLPIIQELHRMKPLLPTQPRPKVLCPGCGVGRLPLDIAAQGYACQGNEFSVFMAIAGHFVLNGIYEKNAFTLHPYIDRNCNQMEALDTLTPVQIPDVVAADAIEGVSDKRSTAFPQDDAFPRFSMSAGDFTEIYRSPEFVGFWDAVVTCFFIDTAPVVIEYVEVIARILKQGGVWVNLGPLLYHWSKEEDADGDERYDQSIELSYEELKHVIAGFGLQIVKEEWRDISYCRDTRSMMWTSYRAVFFTAVKL